MKQRKLKSRNSDTGKLVELEHKETELLNRTRLLEEDIENSEKKLAVLREELESRREKLLASINLIDSGVRLHFQPSIFG